MGVEVRPLAAGDRAAWQALYEGYPAFYGRAPEPGFYDAAFGRLMSGRPGEFRGLVAVDGGRVVGLTHYVFHPNLWRAEGVCYLQDLFTDAAARGQGVGAALIAAVYQAADAAGVPSVYWLTGEDNAAARRLYDRVAVKSPFIRYTRPL